VAPQQVVIDVDLLGVSLLEVAGRNQIPVGTVKSRLKVSGKGDMVTHLWIDKDTCMPLVTELYNANNELVPYALLI
jgi:hypothetical protein